MNRNFEQMSIDSNVEILPLSLVIIVPLRFSQASEDMPKNLPLLNLCLHVEI